MLERGSLVTRMDLEAGRSSSSPVDCQWPATTLYVADTNNHVVRTIDVETREVGTLALDGLTPPAAWSYLR